MRVEERITTASVPTLAGEVRFSTFEGQSITVRASGVLAVEALAADPRSNIYKLDRCRIYFDGHTVVIRGTSLSARAAVDDSLTPPTLGYVLARDDKLQNVDGGSFTSGALRTRDLTTLTDADGLATLASNQLTLAAGLWRCHITCPAYKVNSHQALLYNVTAASIAVLGTSMRSVSTVNSTGVSIIAGVFTSNGTDLYEVQHECLTTSNTNGFGFASDLRAEVFTVAQFFRIA